MKFKYFKITEKETLDEIEQCLVSSEKREIAIVSLIGELKANECFKYNGGIIAYFTFNSPPNKSSWKKVKHGYYPKVKSDENKLIRELPKQIDYRDVIKKYSFGNEMIIGEPNGRRGFPVHSSSIKGNRKSNFYVIKVPYSEDFDREVHKSLVEIKEWEMMRGIEEGGEKQEL